MRKSGFLTFIFSFLPGAGQMYQGYMKRGISIMSVFAFSIVLISTFQMVLFSLMTAVIWFAAFFDTYRVAGRTAEERQNTPDEWIWNQVDFGQKKVTFNQHRALGIGCIVLGSWFLLEQIPSILGHFGIDCGNIGYFLQRYVPGLALAVLLIWFGFRFIAGPQKKEEEPQYYRQPQYVEPEEVPESGSKSAPVEEQGCASEKGEQNE